MFCHRSTRTRVAALVVATLIPAALVNIALTAVFKVAF